MFFTEEEYKFIEVQTENFLQNILIVEEGMKADDLELSTLPAGHFEAGSLDIVQTAQGVLRRVKSRNVMKHSGGKEEVEGIPEV